MARHPWFAPAFVNLADLYRTLGQDKQGEEVLHAALRALPEQADVLHAYGLLLIRNQRYAEAVKRLGQAAGLRPDSARYSYAYALALQKIGNTRKASTVLIAAHDRHPNNRDILFTLAILSRDRGDVATAAQYAKAMLELSPDDPGAQQLLESLNVTP
jgi:Flp pilus assembly protein TadD